MSRLRGVAALVVLGLSWAISAQGPAENSAVKEITVESTAFGNGGSIPVDYTADGKNISPPLSWSNVPASAKEFAVVCEDRDAPTRTPFVHWLLYNIPATAKGVPEGVPPGGILKEGPLAGAIQGLTGFERGAARFNGPSPTRGKQHRYFFTVYVLDAELGLRPGLDRVRLMEAVKQHIVGRGELIGVYESKQ